MNLPNGVRNIFSTNYNHDEAPHSNSMSVDLTRNRYGYTIINNGGYLGLATLREFLTKGIIINTTSKDGMTALHLVCIDGNRECISLLLRYKPLMNVSHVTLGTPLHIFLRSNLRDEHILKKMLDAGGDPNVRDPNGNAALHIEVLRESPKKEFILLLVKYKADINMVNENGSTPLHLAISGGCLNVVHTLLRHGAHIDIKDNSGTTQMKSAFLYRFQYPKILSYVGKHLILQHGRNIPVDLDDLEQLCKIARFRNYKIRCNDEISALKRTTVCPDSYLTYFDMLMAPPDKMAKYVRNLDIVESLENFDRKNFLYGNHIIRNFNQGMRRREAIERKEQFCRAILPTLPEVCIIELAEYLNIEHIEPLQVLLSEINGNNKRIISKP